MSRWPAPVERAFRLQAEACRDLGSPFTARLCMLLAEGGLAPSAVARRVRDWPGDPTAKGDALPLRLAGALHALVLDRQDDALAAVYPPHHEAVRDTELRAAVDGAILRHEGFVLARLDSPPQTNEVRRAAALLPGLMTVARETGLPLILSEVGSSAGLNLHLDRFHYRLGATQWGVPSSPVRLDPGWRGAPAPMAALRIEARRGCDLRPVDLDDHADRIRLLSYLWADQSDRIERTKAAIAIATADPASVDCADAVGWLAKRLANPLDDRSHVVFHTIVWQYLPQEARGRGERLIEEAGKAATDRAPLAWLRLEDDGKRPGAGLSLTLWPGGRTVELARADFHGRWIDWRGC